MEQIKCFTCSGVQGDEKFAQVVARMTNEVNQWLLAEKLTVTARFVIPDGAGYPCVYIFYLQ